MDVVDITDVDRDRLSEKVCACRGIRRCGLCKTLAVDGDGRLKATLKETEQEQEISIFDFCFECGRAFVSYGRETSSPDAEAVVDCHKRHHSDQSFPLGSMKLWREFVTTQEEEALEKEIDCRFWVDSQSGRRKQDYGPKVNFKRQKLSLDKFTGLPDFCQPLLRKMSQETGGTLGDFRCAELCNLEYVPQRESGIDGHIDDQWLWGERLITLNLLSSTILTLTPVEAVNGAFPLVRVAMPRRSLFMMSGEARHIWKHAIRPVDIHSRRLAMTFRELTPLFVTGAERVLGEEILARAYSFAGDVVRPTETMALP
ncbi:putative Alpha-ketoglutarate-dependent dioxygenase alkB-like protein 4 [Hypsibius exemplaris]|uniref:Alpha-ketoglutarate-dependent dioxygenase alkB-like protein 4 n=1 Tax=Hypsibius exemplaris TaxID=2072580 RepID=A0A1W0XAR0_HYPEX|nr:putative Alpha-ketoglutarate-dependent dioxygenase alkB-like protein 4 [Hypsibius exemplaris]